MLMLQTNMISQHWWKLLEWNLSGK